MRALEIPLVSLGAVKWLFFLLGLCEIVSRIDFVLSLARETRVAFFIYRIAEVSVIDNCINKDELDFFDVISDDIKTHRKEKHRTSGNRR